VIAGTVTVADAAPKALATEVAAMVTTRSFAGRGGAVKVVEVPLAVEVGVTLPHGEVEQETVQVTPLLVASPKTVAMKFPFVDANTVADAGATETVTDGIVIVTVADFVLSVTEVAVTVTVRLADVGEPGAV